MATMGQKSSLPQLTRSVSQVLMPDSRLGKQPVHPLVSYVFSRGYVDNVFFTRHHTRRHFAGFARPAAKNPGP
jgi:hypothetical protein